jgi:predicted ATPase
MKITHVHIDRWRNLRDLAFDVPTESALISLVGSNGTGKSNLLELLSFAAAQFGLAAGVHPQQRQLPPGDSSFHVVLTIDEDIEIAQELLDAHLGSETPVAFADWDRTLTLWRFAVVPSERDKPPGYPDGQAGEFVLAGGIEPAWARRQFASAVVQAIAQRLELNHLFLDAERSYGPVALLDEQILAASRQDQQEPQWARQRALAATPGMYEDWLLDALALEHRHDAEFAQAHREAVMRGEPGPAWTDPWSGYREAVRAILPHLEFVRPDQTGKTLVFRAGDSDIGYHELSAGEREVAFLTGQILRFGLRRGLLLLDEPELHLNAELLERWLSWATGSVTVGQVWIATHSLEAVEVAGPSNAFVLERDADGLVRRLNPLSDRPVMSTLSGTLGAPAFSLDRQRFILIEGERPGRERQRFARLVPGSDNLFLEAGNCEQVLRKLAVITALAEETDRLHVGGVIDSDHRDIRQKRRIEAQAPLHILGVHEIENFFLIPEAIEILAERNGDRRGSGQDALRDACDRFAGQWIVQRASLRHDIDLGTTVRARATELDWEQIASDPKAVVNELSNIAELSDETIRPQVRNWIQTAVDQYASVRESDSLWAQCSGKQVLAAVSQLLGLAGGEAMERQVLMLLARQEIPIPPSLSALREYVSAISAAPS